MPLDTWKYVSVTVDAESGKIKIFEDGNMTATHSFIPKTLASPVLGRIGTWTRPGSNILMS